MARKIKIDATILKRLKRKEVKRLENSRSKQKYILIVCEGEKTEPNYFNSLKEDLRKGVLEVCEFRIVGTGHNTKSLVQKAIEIRDKWMGETMRAIDKLWVVFDRDSFTKESFNAAVNNCQKKRPAIDCAWSNEAFELLYLLHFHFYNTKINRKSYPKLIEQNLHDKGISSYKYKKNSSDMYSLLKVHGSQREAIKNAKRLEKNYSKSTDFANQNPCTLVYKIVEELEKLMPH